MSIYRPGKDKKQVIDNILKDLDPSLREIARVILENMSLEELAEVDREELYKRLKNQAKQ
ncbi:hypothetical protein [Desulfurococcus amylolyticus]|uniref:Uncharacterized protein n=1 Tax=Desulfurococcus amylolyticus (strain DSM 18924 / JCM 16383 / VKM B-2413 / 1221n) TaxID=490899 RepID=B8D334_DESA1|nr:hypothetical protein [Desulfurococcus amylolyticus]ACL10447.1 hypothetical protein DKAM_0118 [Desulfurococcus amylolyticus 1221n]